MAAAAFDGGGDGIRIGDVEARVAIDASGGWWRRQASAFDGGDGRRWPLAFGSGDGRQLCKRWTIDTA